MSDVQAAHVIESVREVMVGCAVFLHGTTNAS
jgi:hypothetical protein